ncbi:hypothetical protein S245_015994, partial [Arachis hypogaea]
FVRIHREWRSQFCVYAADNVPPQFVFRRSRCAAVADVRQFFYFVPLLPSLALPKPKHHANDPEPEPVMLDAIPTLKFNQEAINQDT